MTLIVRERSSGQVIASGAPEDNSVLKFEGNWYFAPENIDLTHLNVTERTYTCPYKGVCYWVDLEAPDGTKAQNIAWVYRQPKPGYEQIKDRFGFYARDTAGTLSVVE
ncbi:MAG: DUF427 domain-containing protein [bacterium]|nr:DUF427 domain-containing protein [bacterium]